MEGGRAVVSFRDSCVCVRAETQKLNLRATLVTRFPDFVRPFPGKVFDHSLNGPLVINYRGRAKILCQVFFLFFFFHLFLAPSNPGNHFVSRVNYTFKHFTNG